MLSICYTEIKKKNHVYMSAAVLSSLTESERQSLHGGETRTEGLVGESVVTSKTEGGKKADNRFVSLQRGAGMKKVRRRCKHSNALLLSDLNVGRMKWSERTETGVCTIK